MDGFGWKVLAGVGLFAIAWGLAWMYNHPYQLAGVPEPTPKQLAAENLYSSATLVGRWETRGTPPISLVYNADGTGNWPMPYGGSDCPIEKWSLEGKMLRETVVNFGSRDNIFGEIEIAPDGNSFRLIAPEGLKVMERDPEMRRWLTYYRVVSPR